MATRRRRTTTKRKPAKGHRRAKTVLVKAHMTTTASGRRVHVKGYRRAA